MDPIRLHTRLCVLIGALTWAPFIMWGPPSRVLHYLPASLLTSHATAVHTLWFAIDVLVTVFVGMVAGLRLVWALRRTRWVRENADIRVSMVDEVVVMAGVTAMVLFSFWLYRAHHPSHRPGRAATAARSKAYGDSATRR